MIGNIIKGSVETYGIVEGKVILVYQDAVAFGTNGYVQITMIQIKDDNGKVYDMRPRNIHEIISVAEIKPTTKTPLKKQISNAWSVLRDLINMTFKGYTVFSFRKKEKLADSVVNN